MAGSLCCSKGVVYVGSEEKTAHVRSFDLDGRELEASFSFRGPDDAAASVDGLDLDEDHRLWVADGTGGRLVAFNLFGEELAGVDGLAAGVHDRGGLLGRVIDVCSSGSDDAQELVVASAGARRHALQRLELGSGRTHSLRSGGQVDRSFRDLRGVARRDEWIWAAERGGGRVQVFRGGDFHFEIRLALGGSAPFLPNAVQPVDDGRLALAVGGEASAVLLLDAGGKLLRVLAEAGDGEGSVLEPTDLALAPGVDDRHQRLVVIDREGTRVQLFNLLGDCYGTFPGFARSESSWSLD